MELYPILDCRGKLNDGLWYVISPSSSVQISGGVGAKLCSEGTTVYVTCGALPDQAFGAVYKLCLNTLHLTKLPTDLKPRYEHGAGIHDNQLFVFGGADTSGNRGDTQIMDLGKHKITDTSESLTKGGPSPRTIHNTARHNDNIFLWCGGDQGSHPVMDTDLHVLNLRSKTWRTIKSTGTVPSARHGHVLCAVTSQGKPQLVLHGGMSAAEILGDICSADIEEGKDECKWRKLTVTSRDQPIARSAHSSTSFGDSMYIFGGFTGQGVLDDLWKFDIGTTCWTEIKVAEPRPHPRLDQTICVARLPYSSCSDEETVTRTTAAPTQQNLQDITSLLHESAESNPAQPPSEAELPSISGYQDVLILFGGMDIQGTIFNDLYVIKL